MARKAEKSHNCAFCKNGVKQQAGNARPAPQTAIDLLEWLHAHQAGLEQGQEMKQTMPATNGRNSQAPPSMDTNNKPTVSLPHNLGSITVPPGAQRVDVRFNCVTNKLATGQIMDNLVVNVDVIYHPGSTFGGASHTACKAEGCQASQKL